MTKPSKPRTLRVHPELFAENTGRFVYLQDNWQNSWVWLSRPREARKLADWLTRWADWRESQEGESDD